MTALDVAEHEWTVATQYMQSRTAAAAAANPKIESPQAGAPPPASSSLSTRTEESLYQLPQDEQAYRKYLESKPWTQDVRYFEKVRVAASALVKMVSHASSGGDIEVMGLMQGYIDESTREMIVTDAFALPVEGTETRVNAAAEGYEYMIDYLTFMKTLGKKENVLGWYHSHPGYGCWLSGIDVATQMLHQKHEEPFLAIVIDPHRTLSSGKVDIGAFRTYPQDRAPSAQSSSSAAATAIAAGSAPPASSSSSSAVAAAAATAPESKANGLRSQLIPSNKIEDFGVHANQYYQLDVSIFKSEADQFVLDQLFSSYWRQSLMEQSLKHNQLAMTHELKGLVSEMQNINELAKQAQQYRKAAANASAEDELGSGRTRRPHGGSSHAGKLTALMLQADDTSQSEAEASRHFPSNRGVRRPPSRSSRAPKPEPRDPPSLSALEEAFNKMSEASERLCGDVAKGMLSQAVQTLLLRKQIHDQQPCEHHPHHELN